MGSLVVNIADNQTLAELWQAGCEIDRILSEGQAPVVDLALITWPTPELLSLIVHKARTAQTCGMNLLVRQAPAILKNALDSLHDRCRIQIV